MHEEEEKEGEEEGVRLCHGNPFPNDEEKSSQWDVGLSDETKTKWGKRFRVSRREE
jgi:hypothetical protein